MLRIVAGVLLGGLFVVAGGSKLASGTWPTQAARLGTPRPVASAVPWIELVIGAGLVVQLAPVAFALGASALLIGFTGLLAKLLISGQHPPCACFGGRTARPISWLSIARNITMLTVAIAVIVADSA